MLRRIDEVPWWSFGVARHLFARERRALAIAGELGIAPPLLFAGRDALVRGWIDGLPLHIAKPHGERSFFRSAKAALRKLHRAGICHNDLAKEQNWLRGRDGRAYLTDFQLAARFSRRYLAVPHRGLRGPAAPAQAQAALCARRPHRRRATRAREEEPLDPRSGWRPARRSTTGSPATCCTFTDREGGGPRLVYDAPRIAARLKAHPQVREAVVVAFPDRRVGTGLYAFVEGDPGLTERSLREFHRGRDGGQRRPQSRPSTCR